MPISDKQQKILAFPYTTKYQALICDGAVRSGKTSIMAIAFVDWAMREFNNTNFAICGKTVGSAIKNIITPYMALTYHKDKYNITFNRADNKMTVRYGNKTNVFYVYGGKDESSYMLIQGITLGAVFLDEVALMTRSFVEQALARCSVDGARFWFNCNPENPQHWFYTEWIKPENHAKKKVLYLHFLMMDNPSLSKETLDRYENTYSGVFYDRYILGKWKPAEGVIYRTFADNNHQFIIKDVKEYLRETGQRLAAIFVGVDWGHNGSANAAVAIGLTSNHRQLIALDEFYTKELLTPEWLYTRLVAFLKKVTAEYGACVVYADNAEGMLVRGLKGSCEQNGVRAQVYECFKHKIIDRIILFNVLFSQDRIRISSKCSRLIEGFNNALWNEKVTKDERLDDGSTNICSLDCIEYAVCTEMVNIEKAGHIRY